MIAHIESKKAFHALWILFLNILLVQDGVAQDKLEQPNSSTQGIANENQTVQAELIWTEFDGEKHLLLHSQYREKQWSQPKTIYSSNNAMSSPTLAQLNDQTTAADFAVWTEQRGTKTVLMQTRRIEQNRWQPATQFYAGGTDNFSPYVINDLLGNTFIFWSSSDVNRLADIVYSVKGNDWSTPRPLHAPNKVPDLGPVAALNSNGPIEVSWRTYDFSAGRYVTKSTIVSSVADTTESTGTSNTGNTSNNSGANLIDLVDLEKVPLPNFLPRERGSFTLFSALNNINRAVVRQ